MLKTIAVLIIGVLFLSCSRKSLKSIEFVHNGKPQFLTLRNASENREGFLQTQDEFFIRSEKAVYGDEIEASAELSIGAGEGNVLITVGDNTLVITSEVENEKGEKVVFLRGPSIGESVKIGAMSEYIEADTRFELHVKFNNDKLSYDIDGREIYSRAVETAPAGMIKFGEWGGEFKIYNLKVKGQFKPIAELYNKEFILARSQKSVDKSAEKVRGDPNRPAFHFQPPANWNNDPNGTLFYDGYYHLFYQHNPYSDEWGWMHWGHARSKDLVHWEHLPIALWPSVDKGENHVFSGSGFIKDDGKPILFYTSIGHEQPEHWAAIPADGELRDWQKHPDNPILTMKDHAGKIIDDWRDPYLFRENGSAYMVIGGHPRGGKGSIMLYKALNPELSKWKFLGIPFSGEEDNWECPNFFKIGDKYVLIYSPHSNVRYYTGYFDPAKVKFTPVYHGTVDYTPSWNFYAPNTLQKADGRRILFGWIPGFKGNQGWQGAISIPRELSIDSKNRLVQKPVPEITALRSGEKKYINISLENSSFKLDLKDVQFELTAEVGDGGTDNFGIRFNDEKGEQFEVLLSPEKISMGSAEKVLDPKLDGKIETVHLFFDRTILEIFINDGLLCATKVVYPDRNNLNFEFFNIKGKVKIASITQRPIKSIW